MEKWDKIEFGGLMPRFNKEFLINCFNELDRKKAVGVDEKTKDDYEKNLEENIESLGSVSTIFR